jgi:hypothetical protein
VRGARSLPLAQPPPGGRHDSDVVYGSGRTGSSGRAPGRAIISAPGWLSGGRLTLTAGRGVILAQRDPGGMITLPARPYIVIPAAPGRRCRLHTGDRVLLAALLRDDTLAAYPLAVVDQAIRARALIPGRRPGGRR